MSLVKKDFRKNLKYLKDKRKDVIDSITKICSINAQHAKLLTEALFEEFREVFNCFNRMNYQRPK